MNAIRQPARLLAATLLLALAAGTGCQDYQLNGTEHDELFVQAPAVTVDILFVVDNSPSMIEEQQKVIDGFGAFIDEVMDSRSDFQIGVITTDLETNEGGQLLTYGDGSRWIDPDTANGGYAPAFMQLIGSVGTEGSGWERGLQAVKQALMPSPGGFGDTANEGFLRDDADLALVVISDEDDCSDEGALPHLDQIECYEMEDELVPVRDYVELVQSFKDDPETKVSFSSIVGPPTTTACQDTRTGHRYLTMASKLQGLKGDICEPDFSNIMRDLGLTATGIYTWFPLEAVPDVDTIEVTVDEEPVSEDPDETDGWSYREDDNAIYFWGAAVPEREATIQVHYWTHQ